jgi:iron complex transport system substrate-binding protein
MSGWKPLTDEAAYGMEPEAIVVLATSAPVSPEDIAGRPGLSQSPAVKEGRVVIADALGFIGFGPRVAHTAQATAQKIYPETRFAGLPERAWADEGARAK